MGCVRQRDIRAVEKLLKQCNDDAEYEELKVELDRMKKEYSEFEELFTELR